MTKNHQMAGPNSIGGWKKLIISKGKQLNEKDFSVPPTPLPDRYQSLGFTTSQTSQSPFPFSFIFSFLSS